MKTFYTTVLFEMTLKFPVFMLLLFGLSYSSIANFVTTGATAPESFSAAESIPVTFASVVIMPAQCFGSQDGFIQVVVEGGVSPFTWLWSNGQTSSTAADLAAGIYSVTVTDAAASALVGSWQVTAPSNILIPGVQTNLLCNGQPGGKIDIDVSGGTPPYSYVWNVYPFQGQGTPHVFGLMAGAYTVTVTDNHLCTNVQSWLVTQPAALSTNGIVSNVTCNGGNNGTAALSALGGTSPYSYKWSTGATTQNITGLTAGAYNVKITDANSCVNIAWLTITQPTDITIAGTPLNVTCQGCNNGQIITTVSGGCNGIPAYLWNNGQTGSTASNLTAGTYTVTVTNASGCTKFKSFVVIENLPIIIDPVVIIPAQCSNSNDGSIQLEVSGGVPPFTYMWNNGQSTATAVNLAAGIYTVTVTDAVLAVMAGSWQVTAPSAISISSVQTNVLCKGQNNGKIDISVSGGTSMYSYNWNVYFFQGQGTAHVSALIAGTYTVTVTDNHSCTKIQSWQITQPVALSSNGVATNVTCNGGNNGTAMLSGLGGTAPYTYLWSTGATTQMITGLTAGVYHVTVSDLNNCVNLALLNITQPSDITIAGTPVNVKCAGCSTGLITTTVSGGCSGALAYLWNNGQTASTASNLTAGTYTVTVTNASGCTKSMSFIVMENLPILADAVIIPAQCSYSSDGSVQLFVSGGVSPYTYLWNNGQTTATAVNLAAGMYTVTITDAFMTDTVYNWQVTAPSAISITSVQTNVLCSGQYNGKIDITVSGGGTMYTYNWNVLGFQGQSTPHVSLLIAGTYTVTVTDDHSCMKIQSWQITQPLTLSSNGISTNVTCFGGNNGTAMLSGLGGTAPYTYHWSTGANTQQITGLTAGLYHVTVTDANNCVTCALLSITQPSMIVIDYTAVDVTCEISANGEITTTVTGGSGGTTTYLWSNGQTGSTATNLSAGYYTVTVTNAAGCTATSPPIAVGTAIPAAGSAGLISGSEVVHQEQTGVVYSVEPIENVTIYQWTLPPGAVVVGGFDTRTITVDFSASATSGIIRVQGLNPCGSGIASQDKYITVINLNLILQNNTPEPGNHCYNAFQSITVAGGGSTFIVREGEFTTMIAGQSILYLPGTTVMQGGYMHGYITTSGEFCTTPINPVVNNPAQSGEVQTSVSEVAKNQNVRVYPNPANSYFTLELTGIPESTETSVGIFDMNGVKVLSEKLIGERKHTFSVESLRAGIYLIHVTTGSTSETIKLIRL